MLRRVPFRLPRALGVALLLLGLLPAAPRLAAAQDAAAFIQNLGTQAIQVTGPSVPANVREARLRQLLDADFDLAGASRFALGP